MNLFTESKSKSNMVIGYLVFSFIFSVMLSLYSQDPMLYAFTLFILMAIILATAIDVGDINRDLASVGWSSTNISLVIPLGVIGGIGTLVVGSFVVNVNMMNSLIPDLTSIAKFFTKASIISPIFAVSINIFSQWFIIAPAEEALSKIIAPFAGLKIFHSKITAFFIAIMLWIGMHIPTFIMQGVDNSMYFVLFILGIITTILFFMTNSILSPIIAHGTFNTVVILSSASSDVYGTLVAILVMGVLTLIWLKNSNKTKG